MQLQEMLACFDFLKLEEPCIFLLRHAEKYLVENLMNDIKEGGLTPNGLSFAQGLGVYLNTIYSKIPKIKSSPVDRCVQTAKAIIAGYGAENSEVHLSTKLAHDGVYIIDNNLSMNYYMRYPGIEMFLKMLDGELIPGARNIHEATALLLEDLLADLSKLDRPGIYITHDYVLALFVGTLTNHQITKENWFNYLEGICLKKDQNNELCLYWNRKKLNIHKTCEELLSQYIT